MGSRRLCLPAIPSMTEGHTPPTHPSKAKANRTKPQITADTSETSLYKTEAVDSKKLTFPNRAVARTYRKTAYCALVLFGFLTCFLNFRFGDGYTVTLRVAGLNPNIQPVKEFCQETFRGATLKVSVEFFLEITIAFQAKQTHICYKKLIINGRNNE